MKEFSLGIGGVLLLLFLGFAMSWEYGKVKSCQERGGVYSRGLCHSKESLK